MGNLMIIDWLNAPHDLTNSIQSPAKPRKRKARTLRDSDWAPHKNRISELYSLHPLKHVIETMEIETGFCASERQYKLRIRKWSLDKNIKPKEMMHIVRKRQRRKLLEKDKPEYRYRVNNIEVPPAKISRWMQNHDVPEDEMYAHSLVEGTPSVIDCRTISEASTPLSRSLTPVAMFTGLSISSDMGPTTPTIDDCRQSSPDSRGRRSPTPTLATYVRPADTFTKTAPASRSLTPAPVFTGLSIGSDMATTPSTIDDCRQPSPDSRGRRSPTTTPVTYSFTNTTPVAIVRHVPIAIVRRLPTGRVMQGCTSGVGGHICGKHHCDLWVCPECYAENRTWCEQCPLCGRIPMHVPIGGR